MSERRLTSGIHSIPALSLPSGWRAMQIAEFCRISQGGKLGLTKQDDYQSSGVPTFSAAGQDGFVGKSEFENTKAVILSAIGANCGRCFFAEGSWTTLANVQAIIPEPGVADAKFVFFRVNRDDYWPKSGSAQPFIKPSEIKRCWISLPPADEQAAIARILDTLDTQIEKTQALIAKLQQVKEGLLHDLLTRGVNENGELRPSAEEAPELYKGSPLGLIPKRWATFRVGQVGDVVTGRTPPTTDQLAWGDNTPFITPLDFQDGAIVESAERGISKAGLRHVRLLPSKTTLVVCIGSTIGKVAISSVPCTTNQQINAVIPFAGFDPHFVFLAIRGNIRQIHAWAGLQAVPIVNKSAFSTMLLSVPPEREQKMIVERVQKIESYLALEQRGLIEIGAMKSGLMDDLLTGRVRVTPLLERATAEKN